MLLQALWPISLLQLGQMRDYGNATEDQKGHEVVNKTPVGGSGVCPARDSVTDEPCFRFQGLYTHTCFSSETHCDTDKSEDGKQADFVLIWLVFSASFHRSEQNILQDLSSERPILMTILLLLQISNFRLLSKTINEDTNSPPPSRCKCLWYKP